MTKIAAIVQARMSSSRLPGKVLLDLAGKPVLWHIFNQLSYSKALKDVIVATSYDRTDDPIEKWAHENGYNLFRGDLGNVLSRFYKAAKKFNVDVIARITGDCPLIDPTIVDNVIQGFIDGGFDYFSNNNPSTFPDGLDVEVFSFGALEKAFLNAKYTSEIEHVTPYIRKHPELFKLGNYFSDKNYEKLRWTLDYKEDYKFLSIIFKELFRSNSYIGWKSVINYLEQNPNIQQMNAHFERNEGYRKSIREDKRIE